MKRLALALIPLLSSCSIVTYTFGPIDVHAPEAPAIETSSTVVERGPQLHDGVEIGTPLVIDHCVEHTTEQPEDGCAYVVAVP